MKLAHMHDPLVFKGQQRKYEDDEQRQTEHLPYNSKRVP